MNLSDAIRKPLTAGPVSGKISDKDLAKINAFASRPMTAEDVFAFPAVMANNSYRIDQPWRFGESSLKNFSVDAAAGRPYHIMHDRDRMNGGMTYAAYYDTQTKEARAAVYLLRGMTIDAEAGVTTDREIEAIQRGLRRNVSVGPVGAFAVFRCDACGNDMFSADCPHIMGMVEKGKMITATLDGARLAELSGVDIGAVPGADIGGAAVIPAAAVLKAHSAYEQHKLAANTFRDWLDSYRVPDPTKYISAAVAPSAPGVPDAPGEQDLPDDPDPVEPPTNQPDASAMGIRSKHPMRTLLAAALAAVGLHKAAAGVKGAENDDHDTVAGAMAATVNAEVEARINANPLTAALTAAGIDTVDKLATLTASAKIGDERMVELRAAAEKQATVAFGVDTQEGREKLASVKAIIAQADPALLASVTETLELVAQSKGLQAANGQAAARQTRTAALPTPNETSADVTNAAPAPAPLTHQDIYSNRKKQAVSA